MVKNVWAEGKAMSGNNNENHADIVIVTAHELMRVVSFQLHPKHNGQSLNGYLSPLTTDI